MWSACKTEETSRTNEGKRSSEPGLVGGKKDVMDDAENDDVGGISAEILGAAGASAPGNSFVLDLYSDREW